MGRHKMGLLVTGGSRMTGSDSCVERLLVRARGTSGTGGAGTDGGTMWSGSRKWNELANMTAQSGRRLG